MEVLSPGPMPDGLLTPLKPAWVRAKPVGTMGRRHQSRFLASGCHESTLQITFARFRAGQRRCNLKISTWFRHKISLVILAAVAVGVSGCVTEQSPVTGERRSYGYSWQQELELGAQADKQLVEDMGLYEHPELQAYVEQVGRRVLEKSDMRGPETPEEYRDTPFHFRVLNSPVVNAFAVPGGYIYITRGLLTHTQNEAQLALVLGHEIAHVAARHSSRQALRAQAGQIGLIAGAILGQQVLGADGTRDIASTVLDLGGSAFQLLMFRYSREAERESDELGVRYAGGAGYATAEGSHFFRSLERISESEGRALPSWASTHPDPGDRAVRVRELSEPWAAQSDGPLLVGEEQFLRQLEGTVLGENPREGYVEDGIFYHPELRFQFPAAPGWQLQNERAVVIQVAPKQQAMLGFQIAPGASARDAATRFAQESGVQVVSMNETRISGLPAVSLIAQAQAQQGVVGVMNVFVELDGRVYSFLGYSAAPTFGQFRRTFEGVAGGFAPLTDQRRLEVKPTRIRLLQTDEARPFRDFLPRSLPNGLTNEDLAIINQVEADAVLPAGRWLKLPD